MFAAFPVAVAIGFFAAPALARNAMPASSGSTTYYVRVHKDAMNGSMHKHVHDDGKGFDATRHDEARDLRHGAMMKKGDSRKMDKANSEFKSSSG